MCEVCNTRHGLHSSSRCVRGRRLVRLNAHTKVAIPIQGECRVHSWDKHEHTDVGLESRSATLHEQRVSEVALDNPRGMCL